MKHSQAIARLKGMVAWDQEPALSQAELDALLTSARRPDADGNLIEDVVAWEADTSYVKGDRVTVGDGFAYVCVQEGVTGVTQPVMDETTEDGSVVWQRDGESVWTPTYDLNYAAAEGWLLKAGRAASMVSFQADGARFDRDQIIANCRTLEEHYRQRVVGTVTVPSRKRMVTMPPAKRQRRKRHAK